MCTRVASFSPKIRMDKGREGDLTVRESKAFSDIFGRFKSNFSGFL